MQHLASDWQQRCFTHAAQAGSEAAQTHSEQQKTAEERFRYYASHRHAEMEGVGRLQVKQTPQCIMDWEGDKHTTLHPLQLAAVPGCDPPHPHCPLVYTGGRPGEHARVLLSARRASLWETKPTWITFTIKLTLIFVLKTEKIQYSSYVYCRFCILLGSCGTIHQPRQFFTSLHRQKHRPTVGDGSRTS